MNYPFHRQPNDQNETLAGPSSNYPAVPNNAHILEQLEKRARVLKYPWNNREWRKKHGISIESITKYFESKSKEIDKEKEKQKKKEKRFH